VPWRRWARRSSACVCIVAMSSMSSTWSTVRPARPNCSVRSGDFEASGHQLQKGEEEAEDTSRHGMVKAGQEAGLRWAGRYWTGFEEKKNCQYKVVIYDNVPTIAIGASG